MNPRTVRRGAWMQPCGGPTPCSTPEAVLLSDQRVTVFADIGPELGVDQIRTPAAVVPGLPFDAQLRLLNRHRSAVGPFRYEAFLVPTAQTSTAGVSAAFVSGSVTPRRLRGASGVCRG